MGHARTAVVVPFDPSWALQFEAERQALRGVLGLGVVVHHIGSTAVPGMAAKPIIDLLIEARDVRQLDKLAARFQALGYEPRGENGIPGRRYYVKGSPQRTLHVHAYEQGSRDVLRHLALRDYLRHSTGARDRYMAMKQQALTACAGDAHCYAQHKAAFVAALEAEAMGSPQD